MNAREQGRRAARSLTTVLALSGVALVGGLGVAAYTSIEAAKTAPVRAAGSDGTQAPATNPPTLSRDHEQEGDDDGARAQQTPSSGTSSSSGSSSSGSSSSGSGVSGGSGSSRTSSSGS